MINLRSKKIAGFTLIELMVAVSIFSIVMTMSMGAVLSIVEANRKSRSLQAAMNNLNLVVETVSRNVKFGTNWKCRTNPDDRLTPEEDCISGSVYKEIIFDDRFTLPNAELQRVSYALIPNSSGSGAKIKRKITNNLGLTLGYEPLTFTDININEFKLHVSGVGLDQRQPFLLMTIRGVAGTKVSNQTQFDLQTAVSQRELECLEFQPICN